MRRMEEALRFIRYAKPKRKTCPVQGSMFLWPFLFGLRCYSDSGTLVHEPATRPKLGTRPGNRAKNLFTRKQSNDKKKSRPPHALELDGICFNTTSLHLDRPPSTLGQGWLATNPRPRLTHPRATHAHEILSGIQVQGPPLHIYMDIYLYIHITIAVAWRKTQSRVAVKQPQG